MSLKSKFLEEVNKMESQGHIFSHLVVAVELPTGATEIICNTQQLAEKIDYYCDAYDDQFRLKSNGSVRVVNYMIV